MIADPQIHRDSFLFAQREVLNARRAAQLALRHLDSVGELPIPELKKLAHSSAAAAVRRFKGALGKRAFEIRQLI